MYTSAIFAIKPCENDEDSLVGLRSSLSKIPHSTCSTILALGDFNLPYCDTAQMKDNYSHNQFVISFFLCVK